MDQSQSQRTVKINIISEAEWQQKESFNLTTNLVHSKAKHLRKSKQVRK